MINTQSFIGSTLDVDNREFMAGSDLSFLGDSAAGIKVLGNIKAVGGDIFLIARDVGELGPDIGSRRYGGSGFGQRGAAQASGDERIFIRSGSDTATLDNSGLIEAAGAELKSAGGNEYALAINNTGIIHATGTETRDGHVWLVADKGTVLSSGEITARKGDDGGEVRILGEHVGLTGEALVDVSGARMAALLL